MKLQNILFAVIGPSGSGKTTLVNHITKNDVDRIIVSNTTRKQRPKEMDGIDYYFVNNSKFNQLKKKNRFVENAIYDGNQYGILKTEIIDKTTYHNAFAIVNLDGYNALKETFNNVVPIFININYDGVVSHMKNRLDDDDNKKHRLELFKSECQNLAYFKKENAIILNANNNETVVDLHQQFREQVKNVQKQY